MEEERRAHRGVETYLNTGIIRGPSEESDLVAVREHVSQTKSVAREKIIVSIPDTVARGKVVLEVVNSVAGTLANSTLTIR